MPERIRTSDLSNRRLAEQPAHALGEDIRENAPMVLALGDQRHELKAGIAPAGYRTDHLLRRPQHGFALVFPGRKEHRRVQGPARRGELPFISRW